MSQHDEDLLRSRFINECRSEYPINALHIFAENEPARLHNFEMLKKIEDPQVSIDAFDLVPTKVPSFVYDRILSMNQAKTGGLAFQLQIKVGAKVMLTSNVDIPDKLINGQIGIVAQIITENSVVKLIFKHFYLPGLRRKTF